VRSHAKAHAQVRKALEVAPLADAWALEGEIFASEGRCADARRAAASAAAIEPANVRAAAVRARCP
jgi:hypothetical protein